MEERRGRRLGEQWRDWTWTGETREARARATGAAHESRARRPEEGVGQKVERVDPGKRTGEEEKGGAREKGVAPKKGERRRNRREGKARELEKKRGE